MASCCSVYRDRILDTLALCCFLQFKVICNTKGKFPNLVMSNPEADAVKSVIRSQGLVTVDAHHPPIEIKLSLEVRKSMFFNSLSVLNFRKANVIEINNYFIV